MAYNLPLIIIIIIIIIIICLTVLELVGDLMATDGEDIQDE